MNRSRQAALAIHALSPADRAWLIDRLTARQREALEPLLRELLELGIPADTALVDEALRASAAPGSGEQTLHQQVAALSPAQLGVLLRDEPAPFVACLLAMHAWPWAQDYIDGLDTARRRKLLDAIHDGAAVTSPALRRWLIDELASRAQTRLLPLEQNARLPWPMAEDSLS
jgi:hypothetical protein